MEESEERIVEFKKLNLLGKAVFIGSSAVRLTADLLDKTLEQAADIVVEAERAFKQGRDPNIEEAKIIEERDEREG